MKAKVKKEASLAETIEECNREIERILKIITWLKEMPVREDYMKDYKLIRRLRKRIDKTNDQIRFLLGEDKKDEMILADYLRDTSLKWLKNTDIIAVVKLAEDY